MQVTPDGITVTVAENSGPALEVWMHLAGYARESLVRFIMMSQVMQITHYHVSRFAEFGYESREECAADWSNLQAAHYICNQKKSNRLPSDGRRAEQLPNISDGDW